MKLRDYQLAAKEAIFKEWQTVGSTLVVLPTGAGKTILFASVVEQVQPARALVIAHRSELIWQARDKIMRLTGLDCAIEMGELQASCGLFSKSPVVIATVQTLNSSAGKSRLFGDSKRMAKFKPQEFGLLVIDECHHATAKTYRSVIDHFVRLNPNIKVLLVTATPDRSDEEALGQIAESVAFNYELLDAIDDGWLVPVEQQMVHIEGLDFSAIKTTAGDLNGAELAAVMEAEKNLHGVASSTIEIIGERRALVFTASVQQAETLCAILNRHRLNMAGWVCGKTPQDARTQLLADFQSGSIQVICNCGVLTEGFDDPGVEVVVMARPTKSRSLYSQMAGRSTRPLPGTVDHLDTKGQRKLAIAISKKRKCLIVDFVGNSGRHKLMTTADILGGRVSEKAKEKAIEKAKETGKPVMMTNLLEDEEEDLVEEAKERKVKEDARKAALVAKVKFSTSQVNPFDAFDISPVQERGWEKGKQLTEKQRMLLLRQGLDPDQLGFANGSKILREMFKRWKTGLATMQQCNLLKQKYPKLDVRTLSQKRASELITQLKQNNWRPLENI